MADLASKPTDPTDPSDAANGTFATDTDPVADIAAAVAEAATVPAPTTANFDLDLLSELAQAMHAAATSRLERVNAELERIHIEQVEAIAARDTAEVETLRPSRRPTSA